LNQNLFFEIACSEIALFTFGTPENIGQMIIQEVGKMSKSRDTKKADKKKPQKTAKEKKKEKQEKKNK
jgi:hypothetical protein